MLGIATVGGFQAYEYVNMSTGSVLLENVEALTAGAEGGGRCTGKKEHGECLCRNSNPCSDNSGCKS